MIRYFLRNPDYSFKRATPGASGYDLRADLGTERTINPGERWKVSTGLHLEMPVGIEAQVRSRSGLALNHGVIVLNAPGTVDSDYRGEVCVTIFNTDRQAAYVIKPGDRIAQLVFAPIAGVELEDLVGPNRALRFEPERVEALDFLRGTERGAGGHGSTGR